jgi:hypothetical protein
MCVCLVPRILLMSRKVNGDAGFSVEVGFNPTLNKECCMPDDIHDNWLRIASLTSRLRMVEKSLELKRSQYHDVCVELVVKDEDLNRIKQENLDLRVQLKLTEKSGSTRH